MVESNSCFFSLLFRKDWRAVTACKLLAGWPRTEIEPATLASVQKHHVQASIHKRAKGRRGRCSRRPGSDDTVVGEVTTKCAMTLIYSVWQRFSSITRELLTEHLKNTDQRLLLSTLQTHQYTHLLNWGEGDEVKCNQKVAQISVCSFCIKTG